MTYDEWFAAVDKLIQAKYGIGADDGLDWLSADAHEDGCTPEDGMEIWVEAQGSEF